MGVSQIEIGVKHRIAKTGKTDRAPVSIESRNKDGIGKQHPQWSEAQDRYK
jgi:hypothetical protein